MEKDEALSQMRALINRVYEAEHFKGRVELFRRLSRLFDQINLYKPNSSYYELIVKEAEIVISEFERHLGG